MDYKPLLGKMNYTNSRKLQKPGEIFHTLFILDANSTKLVLCYKDLEKKRNVSLTNFQSQAIVVFEQRTVHNELWRSTEILPRKITVVYQTKRNKCFNLCSFYTEEKRRITHSDWLKKSAYDTK